MSVRRTWRALGALLLATTALTTVPGRDATAAPGDTEVSGTLPSGLTMWSPDQSPYVLTDDVVVPPDGDLYIAPGTTVTSTGDHQLVVNGGLQTSAMTFDLPGGIVIDSSAPAGPGGAQAFFQITTITGATGTAVEVIDGDVHWAFSTISDSATAIEAGPGAGHIDFAHGEIVDVGTVADVAGSITIRTTGLAGFTRGVRASVARLWDDVAAIPTGPCQADGTGCVVATTSTTTASDIEGTWFGTTDLPTLQATIWDDADDAALVPVEGTPAATGFEAELPEIAIDAPAAELPGTAAQLTGRASDASGVVGSAVWIFNATDREVWDEVTQTWVPFAPFEEAQLAYAVTGTEVWTANLPRLVPDTEYWAVAAATESSSRGGVAASAPVSFRTYTAPSAPTITSAIADPDGSLAVTWTAPADAGGLPIETYELACTPSPQPPLGGLDAVTKVVAHTELTATVEPPRAVNHACTVTAISAAGDGDPSAPVAATVPVLPPTFDDVGSGLFFTTPVGWAQGAGLTTGVAGTNTFQPLRNITRAEVITLLWRYEGQPTGHPPHGFDDTTPGAYYDTALDWARDENLTTGVGGTNNFQPTRNITRAETITLLYRAATGNL